MTTKADIIFYGKHIITMDDATTVEGQTTCSAVEAVAVANGTILAVGTMKDVFQHAGDATGVIFLNGLTLIPGLIECHQHATMCAMKNVIFTDISAMKYRTYAEISAAMNERLSQLKAGDWGLFFGWDPELVPDLPSLSATYLDTSFSATTPMIVVGQSGHVAWVNSPALKAANIDNTTESPSGGTIVKDATGRPTGQLFEEPAMMLVFAKVPAPDEAAVAKGFVDQWRYYASVGLTTVTDLAYMPSESTDATLRYLADQPTCPIRVALYKMEHAIHPDEQLRALTRKQTEVACCPSKIFGTVPAVGKAAKAAAKSVGKYSDLLWEAGIKLVADGSPHCGTAAIREPYMNTPLTETLGFPAAPNYGILNMDMDALLNTMKHFHKENTQIAIHSHGERASEQVLRAYEQVLGSELGVRDNRHRMDHCGLTTVDQIARAEKVKVSMSFFVDDLRFYANVYKTDLFGEERVNRWTPLSEAVKCGVLWTIHQDHPTFPGEALPFANMQTAMTRCTRDDPTTPYGPQYRIPVHEALKAYTVNAAKQLHKETELGTISVGKKADLVILSKNPYHVDPFDMNTIQVIESYIGGRSNGFAEVVTIPQTTIKILEKTAA